jgi:hypothetical protein
MRNSENTFVIHDLHALWEKPSLLAESIGDQKALYTQKTPDNGSSSSWTPLEFQHLGQLDTSLNDNRAVNPLPYSDHPAFSSHNPWGQHVVDTSNIHKAGKHFTHLARPELNDHSHNLWRKHDTAIKSPDALTMPKTTENVLREKSSSPQDMQHAEQAVVALNKQHESDNLIEFTDSIETAKEYVKKSPDIRTKHRLKEYFVKAHSGREGDRLKHKQLAREGKAKVDGFVYYHFDSEIKKLKGTPINIENTVRKEGTKLFAVYENVIDTYVQDTVAKGGQISKQAVFDTLIYAMHDSQLQAQARTLFDKNRPTTKREIYTFIRDAIEMMSKSAQGQWASVVAYGGLGQLRGPFPS